MIYQRVKSNKGSGLISALMAMGVLSVISGVALTYNQSRKKDLESIFVRQMAMQIKERLVGAVISPVSWQLTQSKNAIIFSNFSQTNGANINDSHNTDNDQDEHESGNEDDRFDHDHPIATSNRLDIYLNDSTIPYYSATNPTSGFTLMGQPCTGFDAVNGNDQCPFRYEIGVVNHVQQNGSWVDTLRFRLKFKMRTPTYSMNTNNSKFSFDIARNMNDQSPEYICVAIAGTYDPSTSKCSVQLTKPSSSCPTNNSFRGPANSQHPSSCELKNVALSCPQGQVLKSFSTDGTPTCAAPL